MSQWSSLRERVEGKWQVPLFIISGIILVGGLYRVRPRVEKLSAEYAATYLQERVNGGLYEDVISQGSLFLLREDLTDAERAPIHLQIARASSILASSSERPYSEEGLQVVEHYSKAAPFVGEFSAEDVLRIGQAFEWQRRYEPALEYYERAIQRGVGESLDLRRHMIELERENLSASPEHLNELLDVFLLALGTRRLDLHIWAIEEEFDVLEELDRLDEAATLLAREKEYFAGSEYEDHFASLEALLLYKTRHFDDAERYLRTILNRADGRSNVRAMAGWLLGRSVLSDGGPQRPQEAIAFFRDVIANYPQSPYAVASRVGLAEALAYMLRHAEAIEEYKRAIDEIGRRPDVRPVNRDVLRASLGVSSEVQVREGALRPALAYARMTIQLVDANANEMRAIYLRRLAAIESNLGEDLEKAAAENGGDAAAELVEARAMYAESAAHFVELAELSVLSEELSSEASWRGASLYAKAGQRRRAAELFEAFARERPDNPLVARALLRMGQLYHKLGQSEEAIAAFQACYRRFPRSLAGARALVPLARCYLSKGPGFDDLAEKTLQIVLEDSEVFTPRAPEFADALILMGDVLNRRGEYERDIATLEEVLERYPDDPRIPRVRFLLADSYRKSGLALKEEAMEVTSASKMGQMRSEAASRFGQAAELYHEIIDNYEASGVDTLDRLKRLYFRLSNLYEADCYFETQQHREALKLYEQAVGMFKDTPSGLAAYVQMINCHLFLGEPQEARAALARAQILVDAMPDEAFEDSVSPDTRQDWKRYFAWLDKSELF